MVTAAHRSRRSERPRLVRCLGDREASGAASAPHKLFLAGSTTRVDAIAIGGGKKTGAIREQLRTWNSLPGEKRRR